MKFFKTGEEGKKLEWLQQPEIGCWIDLVAPTEEELKFVYNFLGVDPDYLTDSLDIQEKPRIDVEDDNVLIIVHIPYIYEDEGIIRLETIPLSIIVSENYFVTVCINENRVLESFKKDKIKGFYTHKKTRFTFQILYMIAKTFLRYLRYIDKQTDILEESLHKSMKNKELFKLLELEKSLVYFTTALKSNDIVLERLLKEKNLKKYEEDQDLLEDVLIENRQAIDMAEIYSSILNNMMTAFSSVISNNLNIVMKYLTTVTIILAIPTMISGFYGMNVDLPLADFPYAFPALLGLSAVACVVTVVLLNKRKGL